MAFARLLFRVLLGLLFLLVVIGLLLPSSAEVERSIVIDAPADKVFPHINSMQAFHAWSPWSDVDPATEYTFEGPEQGVGSRMRWQSGDSRVGQGSQEITASVSNERVETSLLFGEDGNGKAIFLLEPEGRSTRVRWLFETEFGWDLFGRYVGLMLDTMIGSSYTKGLKELKARIEQPALGPESSAAHPEQHQQQQDPSHQQPGPFGRELQLACGEQEQHPSAQHGEQYKDYS